jgi:hypothetical protein
VSTFIGVIVRVLWASIPCNSKKNIGLVVDLPLRWEIKEDIGLFLKRNREMHGSKLLS